MGGLKKYLPVTFATMVIGTLAIAGIPPFAGFFSKDEILFRAFLANKAIWVIAVATALMTAFYMFRLMCMTFFGAYRGPGVGSGRPRRRRRSPRRDHAKDMRVAAVPRRVASGGRRTRTATRTKTITRCRTGRPTRHAAHDDAHGGGGHGHGPWHGPHESPTPMTFPLMALAVGAIVAGFVGIPAALGGGNAIEQFPRAELHRDHGAARAGRNAAERRRAGGGRGRPRRAARSARTRSGGESRAHVSRADELGLMGFSVLIAIVGIALARKFYVTSPEISVSLAHRFAGAHRVLSNKYYVDELYGATVDRRHVRQRPRPVGVRSPRRRRRGERIGLGDASSARGCRA